MSTGIKNRTLSILLFAFAFLQYVNTLGHDFAWDDKIVIQENERVQSGVSGIPALFKKYSSDLRQDKYGYRPITLTTFAIEYSLFGLDPAGYHFMNVLYFALLCVVLFWVMRTIFESISPILLFVVAMLFAAHPIHVEAVANIKSRDEILAMLFGMLAVYHFVRAYTSGKWKHFLLGPLFFVLAFLSRENAIVFLAIIPLAMLVSKPVTWKSLLVSSSPIFVLVVIALLILNYSNTSQLGAEVTSGFGVYEENHILGNSFLETQHFGDKIANALHLITLYTAKFFAPYPLTYYSGYNVIPVLRVGWQVIGGFAVVLSVIVFALLRFRKQPLIAFGGLFFLIGISVYLQLFLSLSDTMADRFLFLPSLGLCMVLVGVLSWLIKPFGQAEGEAQKLSPRFKVVTTALLCVFSAMTFSRNSVWKDDFTLVSHDLPYLENSARAHYYYASLLNAQLNNEGWNSKKEREMILHYERSIEISDSIFYGRMELGAYLAEHDRLSEGIVIFQEATRIFPSVSDPHHYLGQALIQNEQYLEAIPHLEKSIEFAPRSHDSYHLLIMALGKAGRYDEGIALANEGLEKFPDASGFMYEALGHLCFDMGDMSESVKYTLKTIDHGKNPYEVYATIIGRFQLKGDAENAQIYYNSAVQQGIMQPVSPN